MEFSFATDVGAVHLASPGGIRVTIRSHHLSSYLILITFLSGVYLVCIRCDDSQVKSGRPLLRLQHPREEQLREEQPAADE